MSTDFDVIVVGARCGGSPTAMLLARAGYRVLVVDKARFPSDTMSTHLIHPPGVAALSRWGLLEQVELSGCPAITRYAFDLGEVTIAGSPRPAHGEPRAFGPRRIPLDALLVEAAAAAGAEVREGFAVEEILVEDGRVTGVRGRSDGRASVVSRARLVVGAEGRHSLVAKTVGAERYNETPPQAPLYYAYWSGLPTDGFETYDRAEHGRGWAAMPTNDGLTCVVQGWPREQFHTNRGDVEGTYMRSFDLVPEFAERIHAAERETRFAGTGDVAGFFRKPYGPGWALVGDAGYHKHPITGLGIADAFIDAEALASAVDDAFAGRRSYDQAMAGYQRARDERALPLYELTDEFAKIEPPPPEMQELLAAIHGNQAAMDDFVSVMAMTLPAPEFFAAAAAA